MMLDVTYDGRCGSCIGALTVCRAAVAPDASRFRHADVDDAAFAIGRDLPGRVPGPHA